jgi:hypothetical protein
LIVSKFFLFVTNFYNIVFHVHPDENTQMSTKSNDVLLSSSVGVTMPKNPKGSSYPLEVVNDLEVNYKPRYKSDYFSQDGTVRKPRYVADRFGHHYVTIKVI